MNTASDAITVFNSITNFLFDTEIISGISLGSMIIVVGLIGAAITMITNYKGQG